jgi:hypothetical protein
LIYKYSLICVLLVRFDGLDAEMVLATASERSSRSPVASPAQLSSKTAQNGHASALGSSTSSSTKSGETFCRRQSSRKLARPCYGIRNIDHRLGAQELDVLVPGVPFLLH